MKSLHIHFNINTHLPFNICFSNDFGTTILQRTTTIVLCKIHMLLLLLFPMPIQDKHWYNNKKGRQIAMRISLLIPILIDVFLSLIGTRYDDSVVFLYSKNLLNTGACFYMDYYISLFNA